MQKNKAWIKSLTRRHLSHFQVRQEVLNCTAHFSAPSGNCPTKGKRWKWPTGSGQTSSPTRACRWRTRCKSRAFCTTEKKCWGNSSRVSTCQRREHTNKKMALRRQVIPAPALGLLHRYVDYFISSFSSVPTHPSFNQIWVSRLHITGLKNVYFCGVNAIHFAVNIYQLSQFRLLDCRSTAVLHKECDILNGF